MPSSPSSSEASCKSEPLTPNESPTPLTLNPTKTTSPLPQSTAAATSSAPYRTSAHKKDKKNVREKRRRGELNRKFDTLRELLQIGEGKSKVEKSHILSEAISAIESLKKRNADLLLVVSQLGGPPSNNAALARNPLLPSSGSSSLSFPPYMNILPSLTNPDPAASTLLAQMHANQQYNRTPQSQSTQSNNQQPPLSQAAAQFLMPNQSMNQSMNPNAATSTPTPLSYGPNNQQTQSFPQFTNSQLNPSLAFAQITQQLGLQNQMQQYQQQLQQQTMFNNPSNQPGMTGLPPASQPLTRGSSMNESNLGHSMNPQQHR